MHDVQRTMYNVRCTCTSHIVIRTMYIVLCTYYNVLTLFIVYIYNVHFSLASNIFYNYYTIVGVFKIINLFLSDLLSDFYTAMITETKRIENLTLKHLALNNI